MHSYAILLYKGSHRLKLLFITTSDTASCKKEKKKQNTGKQKILSYSPSVLCELFSPYSTCELNPSSLCHAIK